MSQCFYFDDDPYLRVDASVLFGMLSQIDIFTGRPYADIELLKHVPLEEAYVLRVPFFEYRIKINKTGDYVWVDVNDDWRLLRLTTWGLNRADFLLDLIQSRYGITSIYEQSLNHWNTPEFQHEAPELFGNW